MTGFGYFDSADSSASAPATFYGTIAPETTDPAKLSYVAATLTGLIANTHYIYGTGVAPGTRIVKDSSAVNSVWDLELTSSFSGSIAKEGSNWLLTVASTPALTGTIKAGQVIEGAGTPEVPIGTKILLDHTNNRQWTLTLPSATGFTGIISLISGNTATLTVSGTITGTIRRGQSLSWDAVTGVSAKTFADAIKITGGPDAGGLGVYTIAISGGSMPTDVDDPGVTMNAGFHSDFTVGTALSPIAMTGVGGAIGAATTSLTAAPSTLIVTSRAMTSSIIDTSYDTLQSSAPAYRIGLDGLTDGEYSFIIGGDLSLTPPSDTLTAYNARALTAMASCFDASKSTVLIQPSGSTSSLATSIKALTPVDATSATKNIYASSSFKKGLNFKFTVDRVKPTPTSLTYNDAFPTCRDPSDETTCTDLGPIYTTSPSGEILLPSTLFSDDGTPNEYLRVSVNSEDDRGIKLARQYHSGPRNSAWPSGSLATDPLTLTTTVLTTSSANVRDPAGNAVFMVNATD